MSLTTERQGLLPWPTRTELSDEQRSLYDAIIEGRAVGTGQPFDMTDADGRLHGPFNAMLVNPVVGSAMNQLGLAIRYQTSLTRRETEIAILELARRRSSDFEWYAHEKVGRTVGLTEQELAALRDGSAADTFDDRETLVRTIVAALVQRQPVSGEDVALCQEALGVSGTMELVALVGYYDLLALTLDFWQVPVPG